MIIRRAPDIRSSEITPEGVYRNRRSFLKTAAAAGLVGTALGPRALSGQTGAQEIPPRFATLRSEMDEEANRRPIHRLLGGEHESRLPTLVVLVVDVHILAKKGEDGMEEDLCLTPLRVFLLKVF